MKKIYVGLVALAVTCLVVSLGCRKNAPDVQGATSLSAEAISKDASFISFNEAISRFDPGYQIHVFGDKRSPGELVAKSREILEQLQKDPDNALIQQQLATFYHFRSTAQLKEYSARISTTLQEMDTRYDLRKTLITPGGGALYAQARLLFVKDKYEQLKHNARQLNGGQRRTDLWQEYVEAELSDFGELAYYNPYDESFDPNVEMGGGGCNGEVCCLKNEVCRSEALGNLLTYIAVYGGGGVLAGGKIGGAAGTTTVPGPGSAAGAIMGGILGGVTGTVYAFAKYYNDLSVCRAKYDLCLAEKKNNP